MLYFLNAEMCFVKVNWLRLNLNVSVVGKMKDRHPLDLFHFNDIQRTEYESMNLSVWKR